MKTRIDFVSNSSSSSYIIDVGQVSAKEAADIVAKNIGDGEDERGNNWLWPLFEENVALTCVEICYHAPDSKFSNSIPSGIAVHAEELIEYFDANGNVRADLDKRKVIEKLSWNKIGKDGWCGENEYAVYDARPWGMTIDSRTVKFTEWLIAACKEICDANYVYLGYSAEDADEHSKNLKEIKDSLANGNSVYLIQTCYSGDPDCGLYVADSNEKNNGWKRLRKVCKKMLWTGDC